MRKDFGHRVTKDNECCDDLAGGYCRYAFEETSKHAYGVVEFLLVSVFDQSLGGMTEGSVPYVVQKGCQARGVAILRNHLWHILVAVLAELSSMVGVLFERLDHAFCGFYHTLCVLEAVMASTRIDEMCHSELTHASQPLEQRRVQKHRFPRHELHDAPDGVVECLRITGVRRGGMESSECRRCPMLSKGTEILPESRGGGHERRTNLRRIDC